MELEIRHLRIICAIDETGSLTRAAAALRLTQPGLSAQLRRIETLLGGPLFDRSSSGAVPTAYGEAVLARARAVLPAIDDLLGTTAPASRSGGAVPHFRLGSVNAPLLGGLITALKAHHPGARIVTRGQGSSVPLVDDVANGRLDLAVVGDSPGYELAPRPGVALHPVATEPLFVALPADHRLAARDEVTLDELADADWASPPPDDDRVREYWSTTFLATGQRMRTAHEVEGRLLLEVVRSGHAVSLCQATFEEVPGIAVRPIAGSPLWYRHLLAWHRAGPLTHLGPALARRAGETHRAAASRSPAYRRWLQNHRTEPPAADTADGPDADR
ncbi:LysR family transcriptional regulator [Kitasatospora atroaurantiaca]|uniref:DNA-binding transcriptional LysR family regulator n=1 Tax=Kitasatospora atroaurantiaca TaxID=285545 RepID=A0A561F140_9ACTN|nr:LysR family transcriptional regulator [Kitasatospora atroaurantiaca]TWE21587.1 DNA-binding transcriptional LysR family regulator [Kitasatospora atroaurantiaca]